MKPPSIVIDHFLSTKWSKKLFTINHYELQNGKCIVTQELSAYEKTLETEYKKNIELNRGEGDSLKIRFLDEKYQLYQNGKLKHIQVKDE